MVRTSDARIRLRRRRKTRGATGGSSCSSASNADGTPGSHLALEPGTLVDVEGPLGSFTFPPAPVERRFVFIAGGTGIAPLRAMMQRALHLPHRNIGLFYSVRTPDEFAYEMELRGLADAGEIELRQTVTRATDMDWTGPRGRLNREALEELIHDPATLCFVCGPPALVDEMPKILTELGIPQATDQGFEGVVGLMNSTPRPWRGSRNRPSGFLR